MMNLDKRSTQAHGALEGQRSISGEGRGSGGRSEHGVVVDSMGDGLMKRRRMTSAEVGSLKKAMVVVVVVEVKVGGHALPFLVDTNCHFNQHDRPTSSLSDGRPKKTKRSKQQGKHRWGAGQSSSDAFVNDLQRVINSLVFLVALDPSHPSFRHFFVGVSHIAESEGRAVDFSDLIPADSVLRRLSEELYAFAFPALNTWRLIKDRMASKGSSWHKVRSEKLPSGLSNREDGGNLADETPSVSGLSKGDGFERLWIARSYLSIVDEESLKKMRDRYQILEDVVLRILNPDERACSSKYDDVAFYEADFNAAQHIISSDTLCRRMTVLKESRTLSVVLAKIRNLNFSPRTKESYELLVLSGQLLHLSAVSGTLSCQLLDVGSEGLQLPIRGIQVLVTGVSCFHGERGYLNQPFLVSQGKKRNGNKQIGSHKRCQLMMCKNQHDHSTSSLSDGKP
uniref:Uncharacterized protein n=1 Tax=Fagus sylvatica TaxID=28930 RepID=A0A2N9FJN7_FAGSY